jgi:hypothetical protein
MSGNWPQTPPPTSKHAASRVAYGIETAADKHALELKGL